MFDFLLDAYKSNVIDTPANDFSGNSANIDMSNRFDGSSILLGIVIGLFIAFCIYKIYSNIKSKKWYRQR